MTDYVKKSFSVTVGSDEYREGWDCVFRAERCALCGQTALGYARAEKNERLCHDDLRSCYTAWTRDGKRP